MKELHTFFQNKDILITGGCGSIGSEVVRQLIKFKPKLIRVLDNNESGQFYLHQELEEHDNVRYLIGDIRDKKRLQLAVKGVDIVFHAAALKHVPLCEYHPYETVLSNVIGTQNIVEASREANVDTFIGISTDKVVNPINTMGASKLLSEKLIINGALGDYETKYNYRTKFSCVRFGNVLNSRGSVIPTFKLQIKKGGPVTLTHPDMTRFFMSLQDAVNLVLRSAATTTGREIFILKMRKLKISDLAESMINNLASKYGHNPADIKIREIGIRPGEKMHELLMNKEESVNVIRNDDKIIVIKPNFISPTYSEKSINLSAQQIYSSEEEPHLTQDEIIEELKSQNALDD